MPASLLDSSRFDVLRHSKSPAGVPTSNGSFVHATRSRASAMDVTLELLDRLLLLLDHRLHQISDRYHADDAAAVDHGKMADATVGHDPHAILYRLVERYGDHR